MSVKMMSLVFDRFPYGGNERVLALAMADHAHDDGTSIYAGNARLAEKSLMSERTVIRIIQKFLKIGWLIKVNQGNSGRGLANEYCINPNWIKGDNLSPFTEEKRVTKNAERVTNLTERVTNDAQKGDTAMSHQQELTKYNQEQHRAREATPPQKQAMRPEGELACRLINLQVAVTSMHPTLLGWVKDKIPFEFILQCVNLARQQKPLPERIPANYLDKIIRAELKPKTGNAWQNTDEGILAKGKELGLPPRPGEEKAQYKARLIQAIQNNALKTQVAA